MKNLQQIEKKIREVALDLTEPQDGANMSHQVKKLNQAADDLQKVHGGGTGGNAPQASTQVHGGGTGED